MSDLLSEPTDDVLERICDAQWNGGKGDGITFSAIHQHNVCNHTLVGEIDVDGHVYGFVIDNGDWNGTEVRQWDADPENVGWREPAPPEPATFLPAKIDHVANPGLWRVYATWRKERWFADKVRGLNYDRHFAPGGATEKHYREWAATKGLKIGFLSDLRPEARAMLSWTDAQWAQSASSLAQVARHEIELRKELSDSLSKGDAP